MRQNDCRWNDGRQNDYRWNDMWQNALEENDKVAVDKVSEANDVKWYEN